MATTPGSEQPPATGAVQNIAFPAGRSGSEAPCPASAAPPRLDRPRQPEVPKVSWTAEAESDLQRVVEDPAVRHQLKRNAEVTLHEIEASGGGDRRSEGREGEIMWHRGWDHEQERRESWYPEQADDGPWNYILFYRSAGAPAEFEVLAVRGRPEIADRIWAQMKNGNQPPGARPATGAAA
jgi:hypothetical protein